MIAVVVVLCLANAQVPECLETMQYQPGFQFQCGLYAMEVWKVECKGGVVWIYFQSREHKNRNFYGNPMTARELQKVLKERRP